MATTGDASTSGSSPQEESPTIGFPPAEVSPAAGATQLSYLQVTVVLLASR